MDTNPASLIPAMTFSGRSREEKACASVGAWVGDSVVVSAAGSFSCWSYSVTVLVFPLQNGDDFKKRHHRAPGGAPRSMDDNVSH